MSNLLQEIAERKTTQEIYPPEDEDGPELAYDFLVDRANLLDHLIQQARDTQTTVVTITADGNIQVDNPDNFPLSIRDYDTVEFLLEEQDLEEIADNYGENLRMDSDDEWYIERGNQ